jgi:hypothetical protein
MLNRTASGVLKVCYTVLQHCVRVGGNICGYNKCIHGMGHFKFENQRFYCAVRSESLNIIQVNVPISKG